jgi:hypothetical protein
MANKIFITCIIFLLVYCSADITEKNGQFLTARSKISIEKARELKLLFCKTQIVGKEENFKYVAEVVDSFYVFSGSFYIFKSSARKKGIWVNMYSGVVFNGKDNVKKGNGWKPDKKNIGR